MNKSFVTLLSAVALMAACSTHALAQDGSAKKETKASSTETSAPQADAKKDKKPDASPGWIVIEEEWWSPFRFDFSDSLHRARVHHRAREEKAAAAEIDKAVSWLKYAESHAATLSKTAEELSTARADLTDFATKLRSGKPVNARSLDTAFAHASSALAKHHHFKSSKALATGDLKLAGKHLFAAADHLRHAARSANYEYGDEIVEFYDDYGPYGYWDETVILKKNEVESNLKTVESELEKLAKKMGAKK